MGKMGTQFIILNVNSGEMVQLVIVVIPEQVLNYSVANVERFPLLFFYLCITFHQNDPMPL